MFCPHEWQCTGLNSWRSQDYAEKISRAAVKFLDHHQVTKPSFIHHNARADCHSHTRAQQINHELTVNQATRPLDPFFMYFCTESVHTPHSPPNTLFGEKVAGTQLAPHLDMLWELELQVGCVLSIPPALALLTVSRACRSAF